MIYLILQNTNYTVVRTLFCYLFHPVHKLTAFHMALHQCCSSEEMFRQPIFSTVVPTKKMGRFIPDTRVPEEFKCLHKWKQMLICKFHLHDTKSWGWNMENRIYHTDVWCHAKTWTPLLSEGPVHQKTCELQPCILETISGQTFVWIEFSWGWFLHLGKSIGKFHLVSHNIYLVFRKGTTNLCLWYFNLFFSQSLFFTCLYPL